MIRKEFAQNMQRLIALKRLTIPDRGKTTPETLLLTARWYWWHSKYSRSPRECLSAAKNQYRLARDMMRRPQEYQHKSPNITHWQLYQKLLQGDAAKTKQLIQKVEGSGK